MKALVVASLLTLFCSQAIASDSFLFESGNDLKKYLITCNKNTGSTQCRYATAYIVGVADSDAPNQCMPAGVTREQLRAVVGKWMARHPEDLHFVAAYNVKVAFSTAFPCR